MTTHVRSTGPAQQVLLLVTVFVSGSCVMMLEIVGMRMFAPFLGTTLYVATSIIGVVMGSLSIGYFLGGKIADRWAQNGMLTAALAIAGTLVLGTAFCQEKWLYYFGNQYDIASGSLFAALAIFAPFNVVLGTVTPIAVRLSCASERTIGNAAGTIYAVSTVGSIAGTFLAGFWLIPLLGSLEILLIVAATLLFDALLPLVLSKRNATLATAAVLTILTTAGMMRLQHFRAIAAAPTQGDVIADFNTQYRRVQIWEEGSGDERVRVLSDWQSAIYTEESRRGELVQTYLKYFRLAEHFSPDFRSAVIIGGAGYAFPRFFLHAYPQRTIDVVDIDPAMTDIAQEYFDFQPTEHVRSIVQDGRIFLNTTEEKYDVVYMDAFSNLSSVPSQLTTHEAMQQIDRVLNEDGILLMNIISRKEGPEGQYFRAQYHTMRRVFPQVLVFPIRSDDERSNIILIAMKSPHPIAMTRSDEGLQWFLDHQYTDPVPNDVPLLTDNHAPVEYYVTRAIYCLQNAGASGCNVSQ